MEYISRNASDVLKLKAAYERALIRALRRGNHILATTNLNDKGYGRITAELSTGKQHFKLTRLAAWIHLGLNLDDREVLVCHKDAVCTYKACFYHDHLYVGTALDNVQDSILRGTWGGAPERPLSAAQEQTRIKNARLRIAVVRRELGLPNNIHSGYSL